MERSRDYGRIWRRTIGLGAFALFLAGLLVALDLEELVVIAAALAALCGLAGVLTLLLVHYRRGLVHGVATAGRVTAPQVARASKGTAAGTRRVAVASGRAGRSAALGVAAAGAATARATQGGVRRTIPVLRRADDWLGVRVRAAAASGRRHSVRAWNVVAADIHAHRDAMRSSSPRAGEPVRPTSPKEAEPRRPPTSRHAAGEGAAAR